MSKYNQINLNKIKTYSIKDRLSKVNIDSFARPYQKGNSLQQFISDLPDILIGADFKELVDKIADAYKTNKQIIVMMGAHVIKCGLNPIIIKLMEAGIIKCLALNGAGVIHDTEVANWGITSEDVADALEDGSFGMVQETPQFINSALSDGKKLDLGFGESVGKKIHESDCEFKHLSILEAGYRLNIPITVHVAIGTDIIHQHPNTSGNIIGELSFRDFKIFSYQVAKLKKDAVVLNFGSAVILPEVFLKALTVARNLGNKAHGFITANFDMLQHYRPQVNIVQRPTKTGGKGYQFTGHHEIMIPLLAAAVLERIE
ncbi:hypothetical protein H8E88_16415 [candidate division KSB1 bacterium]|nr:hypothetical protein [candidate division KSB1 bacterium]